jgi:hypothetical protein
MIYIRIELWPHGLSSKARLLHEGVIANVGGTATRGDYTYALGRKGAKLAAILAGSGAIKVGSVKGFPRQRLGAWQLLYLALHDAFGELDES